MPLSGRLTINRFGGISSRDPDRNIIASAGNLGGRP